MFASKFEAKRLRLTLRSVGGRLLRRLGQYGHGTAALLTHDMSVVADIADEGGPHVCWAHRAACATSATSQSPAGSYLITAPAVTAQWQRHLRRLPPRSTFSQQTTCDRPVHGQGGKRPDKCRTCWHCQLWAHRSDQGGSDRHARLAGRCLDISEAQLIQYQWTLNITGH